MGIDADKYTRLTSALETLDMNWQEFKKFSEEKLKRIELYSNVSGYQIQPGTKWKQGLKEQDIVKLESKFGFQFPQAYREFLKTMNGFDTLQVAIEPDEVENDNYAQKCYQYPLDFGKQDTHLLSDLEKYKGTALTVLDNHGFKIDSFEGFLPLYSHRALAVFENKELTPVISVWGDDIVVMAENLEEYWIKELNL